MSTDQRPAQDPEPDVQAATNTAARSGPHPAPLTHPPLPGLLQQAQTRLRAKVVSRAWQQIWAWRRGLGERVRPPAYRQLADHLAVEPAYDFPDRILGLSTDDLDLWRLDLQRALSIARDNLARITAGPFLQRPSGLYESAWGDNYDVARLLVPASRWLPEPRTRWVAMAACSETLLLADESDQAALADMAARTDLDHPRFISGIPLVLQDGEWRTYEPPPGMPAYEALRRLKWRTLAREYALQKAALGLVLKEQGVTDFAASLQMATDPAGNDMIPFASWIEGASVLLPQSEYVAFGCVSKGDRSLAWGIGMARRDRMVSVIGGRMRPMGMYPERWRVAKFPTRAEFRRMGMKPGYADLVK